MPKPEASKDGEPSGPSNSRALQRDGLPIQDELADVEGLLAELPSLGDGKDLDTIHSLLSAVSPETAIEALARAFTLAPSEKLRQEREASLRHLDIVRDLHQRLSQFADAIAGQRKTLKSLLEETLVLGSTQQVTERQHSSAGHNPVVRHYDEITTSLCEQAGFMLAMVQSGSLYKKLAGKIASDLAEADTLQRKETHLAKLDEHVSAFLGVINAFETRLRCFPNYCNSLAENIREHILEITALYAPEPSKTEDDPAPKSIFDMFSGRGPQRLDVPIYRNNPLQTAYLHSLSQRIPELDEEQRSAVKKLSRIPEVKYFIDTIQHNSDPVVIAYMRAKEHYEGAARGIAGLHSALRVGFLALKASGVRDSLRDSKISAAAVYAKIRESVEDQLPGQGSTLKRYEDFNPAEIIEMIGSATTIKTNNDPEKAGPKKRVSKFDAAYLELFAKLDETTTAVSTKKAGRPEIEKFISELLDLDLKTGNQKERRQSAELQQDIDKNNHGFTVAQGDHGSLRLERVPTGNSKFADLIGDSWVKVEETIDSLLDYSQFSGLYTQMTKRGKVNNNAIIAGPAGCGKNMFLRVLQSDPRVIGVNMSTDRVLSMWHGQSEGNVRELFELCYEKRQRHDKPVAIGWDEIDALFGQRRGGVTTGTSDITFRMQKVLQSVLDGDTFYEGVALIGFTNEPQHIPATVFRRFANVVVIDPLTASERKTLLEDYLIGLPLEEDFGRLASWDDFLNQTPHAHGDVIGKVFDRIFKQYVGEIKHEAPDEAIALNQRVLDLQNDGIEINQAKRRELFQEFVPEHVVTAAHFHKAFTYVLSQKDVKGAMENQELFYQTINTKLGEAFE